MKIYIVAITFAITVGGLFLFENFKTPPKEDNYAQIIKNLQNQSTQKSDYPSIEPLPTQTPKKTPTPTTVKTPLPPTPLPTPPPTPVSHIFYTSSYATAKYYYCDTDNDWKTLSAEYLKVFSSSEELLKNYQTRTPHEPCK